MWREPTALFRPVRPWNLRRRIPTAKTDWMSTMMALLLHSGLATVGGQMNLPTGRRGWSPHLGVGVPTNGTWMALFAGAISRALWDDVAADSPVAIGRGG